MKLEIYTVKADSSKKRYRFISKGPMGNIRKVAAFQKLGDNFFNLAFGDWDKKKRLIDSKIRSNNGDRDKVLATVAHIILIFFNHFEDAVVKIEGETKARTRLYQMGINKYLEEISLSYRIEGIVNGKGELFQPGKNYENFHVRKILNCNL